MIFTFYFVLKVILNQVFQPNHFVPLLFHPQQQKRKLTHESKASVGGKKQKSSANIAHFFTVAEKPVVTSMSKAPNETYSSPAALATAQINLDQQPSTSKESAAEEVKSNIVNNFDVSLYRKKVKGMNNPEICNLIKNVHRPDKSYCFPKVNGRCFRYE